MILGTRKTFFSNLRTVACNMVFDSWDKLFPIMEEGLGFARIDVPGDKHCTFSFRGIAKKNTRTGSITIAGFEIGAAKIPFFRHDSLSFLLLKINYWCRQRYPISTLSWNHLQKVYLGVYFQFSSG